MRASITLEVAEYAASLTYSELPPEVVLAAKQSILDWVGVALAGSREPIARIVDRFLEGAGGGSGASVVGRPGLIAPPFAALANGAIGHALDFDDTHLAARLHTTAAVLPAALAVADARGLGGQELIAAYLAGFEAATAIACAADPGHYEAGWHTTGTIGTLGAAIAAGRALQLPPRSMSWAIGLAATQAAGLQRVFGSMAKPFNAGRAASGGCTAALLAAEGMTAPDDVLEGPRGLLGLLGAEERPTAWRPPDKASRNILRNTVKLYACCHALHAAIEAALRLRARLEVDWRSVAGIEVAGWPVAGNIAAIRSPSSGYEAKFSVFHAMAAVILEGAAGPDQFAEDKVHDERIRYLTDRVSFRPRQGLDVDSAVVTITLADGRRIQETSDTVSGAVGTPEAWPPIERKFLECARPVLGDSGARGAIDRIKRLDSIERMLPFWSGLTAFEPAGATGSAVDG